jgi:hypothetical protein
MSADFIDWDQAAERVLVAFDGLRDHWASVDLRLLGRGDVEGRIRPHWIRMAASFEAVAESSLERRVISPLLLHGRLTVDDARRLIWSWLEQQPISISGTQLGTLSVASNVSLDLGAQLTEQDGYVWTLGGRSMRFRGMKLDGYSSASDTAVAHAISRELVEKATVMGFRDRAHLLQEEMRAAEHEVPAAETFAFGGPLPLTIEGSQLAPELAELRVLWRRSVNLGMYQLAGPAATWNVSLPRDEIRGGQAVDNGWDRISIEVNVPPDTDTARAWLVKNDEPYLNAAIDLVAHTRARQVPLALESLYPSGALRKALLPASTSGDATVHFEEAVVNLFGAAGFATLASGHNRKSRGIDGVAFDSDNGVCYCLSATIGAKLQDRLGTLLLERTALQERLDRWTMRGVIASPVVPADVQAALKDCAEARVLVLARPHLERLADAPHELRAMVARLLQQLEALQRSRVGQGFRFGEIV